MNSSEGEHFYVRTKELADDICKVYASKIAEYAATATSTWDKSNRTELTAFACVMGIGLMGGTMVAAVRQMAGEEAAGAVLAVLLATIEHTAKP